jgi:hypothetical protein
MQRIINEMICVTYDCNIRLVLGVRVGVGSTKHAHVLSHWATPGPIISMYKISRSNLL